MSPIASLWKPALDAVRSAYSTQTYPLGYSPGFDGMRGLMTLVTLASHIHHPAVIGSVMLMDIFFVMSGYFITGLLIRDVRQHGRVRFGHFYRRRFARLVPVLLTMLVVFVCVGTILEPRPLPEVLYEAAIGAGYLVNWWRAFDWPGIRSTGHLWSLAIEEQFYLLWPLTFLLLWRAFGLGWRLVGSVLTLAAGVWAWRCWLTWHGTAPYSRVYNGFDTRADALMIGCALALVLALVPLDNRPGVDRWLRRLAWVVLIGWPALTVFGYFLYYAQPYYYYVGITLGAVIGVLCMLVLRRPLDTVLHRVFARRPCVFLGRIFYAMYVWHFPLFVSMMRRGWPIWVRAAIGYPVALVLATLSFAFVERHFLRR